MTPIALVYPFDPFGLKIGGIQTFLRGFIAHAPPDFDIRILGVSTDRSARPPRTPMRIELAGRSVTFLPVLYDATENSRAGLPLSLRFYIAARQWREWCRDRVLLFNRLEPALAFRGVRFPKIGFVHTDVTSMLNKGSEVGWRHFPRMYNWVEKRLLREFDMLYTVNGNTLVSYRKRYPALHDRLAFLPTWVDKEVFSPAETAKRALRIAAPLRDACPIDVPWLLFVGRFQNTKDPLLLVESFAALRKRGTPAILLMVGAGDMRADIESCALRLGVRKDVYLLGAVEQSELAKLYRCADVLLLTSHYEGMPRAALEAVGSALPVVTMRVGEVARFVIPGITGEIVDSRNPEAVSAAVLQVLMNRDKYTVDACMAAVAEFRPEGVLRPVYERVQAMAQQHGFDALRSL